MLNEGRRQVQRDSLLAPNDNPGRLTHNVSVISSTPTESTGITGTTERSTAAGPAQQFYWRGRDAGGTIPLTR